MDEKALLWFCLSEQKDLLVRLLKHAETECETLSNMIGDIDKRLADLGSDVTNAA